MSTLTNSTGERFTQEKEIRALALQAAATWAGGYGNVVSDMVMDVARDFEDYIENGTIPSDKADELDLHGPGGTGPGL